MTVTKLTKSLLFTICNIILCFLSISCSKSGRDKVLQDYFKEKHNYRIPNNISKVYVVTENGCYTCNKKFAMEVLKNADNPNVLFLINASGAKLDISSFDTIKAKVFYDADNKDELFRNSSVIALKESVIDTVITIKAETIEKDLKFINSI